VRQFNGNEKGPGDVPGPSGEKLRAREISSVMVSLLACLMLLVLVCHRLSGAVCIAVHLVDFSLMVSFVSPPMVMMLHLGGFMLLMLSLAGLRPVRIIGRRLGVLVFGLFLDFVMLVLRILNQR